LIQLKTVNQYLSTELKHKSAFPLTVLASEQEQSSIFVTWACALPF